MNLILRNGCCNPNAWQKIAEETYGCALVEQGANETECWAVYRSAWRYIPVDPGYLGADQDCCVRGEVIYRIQAGQLVHRVASVHLFYGDPGTGDCPESEEYEIWTHISEIGGYVDLPCGTGWYWEEDDHYPFECTYEPDCDMGTYAIPMEVAP